MRVRLARIDRDGADDHNSFVDRALRDHGKELRLKIWKLSLWLLIGAVLAHCAKSANTLDVSPPLPPAEEPGDDVKGAYVDAGVAPQGPTPSEEQ